MTEETENKLDELSELGNTEMNNENYKEAIQYFNQALEVIPDPKEMYEASGWLHASIGDAYFFMNEYSKALDNFLLAYKIYGIEGVNPFILLRTGQCYYELDNKKQALDFLLRAYMLDGEEIFEDEEEYFNFLKNNVDIN